MKKRTLKDLRKSIDKIDSNIIDLVSKRGLLSMEIGGIKHKKGQEIYAPDRESQVYKKVAQMNNGPLNDDTVKAIYSEIMSGCLSLEQPLKIAYLGPEFTYTHQVSMKKFGSSVDYISSDSITDVFREVEKGNADYGVVPIENSTEGAVNHTLDMFIDSNLVICSEILYRIRHSLMGADARIDSIKKIYSKPQVFGQCRKWIEGNLPKAELKESSSTAKAAEIVAKNKGAACIASEIAAKHYKLKVLAASIEDSSRNFTRFLVIGKKMSEVSGNDKTSVVFSVKDRPGVLHDALNIFKDEKINLTKIESRPSKIEAWKYYFFIDMEGHVKQPRLARAIEALGKNCYFFKVLGSYPKG